MYVYCLQHHRHCPRIPPPYHSIFNNKNLKFFHFFFTVYYMGHYQRRYKNKLDAKGTQALNSSIYLKVWGVWSFIETSKL